jgi:hypothetical protein
MLVWFLLDTSNQLVLSLFHAGPDRIATTWRPTLPEQPPRWCHASSPENRQILWGWLLRAQPAVMPALNALISNAIGKRLSALAIEHDLSSLTSHEWIMVNLQQNHLVLFVWASSEGCVVTITIWFFMVLFTAGVFHLYGVLQAQL